MVKFPTGTGGNEGEESGERGELEQEGTRG